MSEMGCEKRFDGGAALRRGHRNVVVHGIFGEVAQDLSGIRVGPQGAELGHQFLGGLRHVSMKRNDTT